MSEAINKQDIIKGDPFGDIQKDILGALSALEQFDSSLKSTAATLSKDVTGASKKTVEGINEINKAEIESEKLLKQKLATQQAEIKLQIESEKLTQARIRTQKAENSTKEKTLTLYQQESKKLNDLRNAYKNLAVQNKENSKEAKLLLHQVTVLDTKLKTIDKTVGQNQRNVGNYEGAIDKLRGKFGLLTNVLGQFGLAVGGVAILKGAVETVAEFETQVADLSAVTGQTGKDLDFLKQKAIDFSKQYGESAASIAEAFKLAGSARPELLQNGEALTELTEKAIILSKASGDDVPTSIKNLTGTLNAFELDAKNAGEVMDVLANAAQLGSQEIPYLTEAFTKFGAIAKSSNISVAESAAAVELLGEKFPDAASAGTGLRNVMLKLMAPDALGKDAQERLKALGVDFAALSDKNKTFAERLEVLKPLLGDAGALVKVFGSENAVAAQVLLSSTDRLTKFTEGLDKNGTAQEQAAVKSATLAEAGKRLKSTFDAFILNMANGVGASKGLTAALDFLAENFDTIVSVLGKLIKLYVTYKAVMLALKMRDRITEFVDYRKAVKETGVAMTEGSENAKKFGAALKSMGLAVAIDLLLEAAAAFYEYSSGALEAKYNQEQFNKGVEEGNEIVERFIGKLNKRTETELNRLNLLKAEDKINEENYNKELQRINNLSKAEINAKLRTAYALLKSQQELLREKEKEIKANNALLDPTKENELMKQIGALKKNIGEVTGFIRGLNDEKEKLNATQSDLVLEEATLETQSKKVEKKKKENEEREKSIHYIRKETAAIEEQEMARTLDSEEVEKAMLIDEERRVLAAEIRLIEAEITLEKAMQAGNSKAILEAEQRVKEAKLEQINAQAELDKAKTDVTDVNERERIEKQRELDELRLNEATDSQKEMFEMYKGFQEAITEVLIDQIDKRIALLKKEEEAAKNQQDYLEELAANGNITAQQSIAEQIQIQREAQAEQARLERQKQNIQLISSGLETFNAQLESGKTPASALASTIASTQVLVGFLKNLQFFAKGTDNAPGGLAVVDEEGVEIITDSRGRIKDVGTNKGARFVNLSKGDKVYTAEQTADLLNGFGNVENANVMNRKMDSAGNSYDLLAISKGLKNVEDAIKNKSEYTVYWDTHGNTIERVNRGGNICVNRYRKN